MIKFQSFLSGSSGNATYVTDDTVSFLVDCGANGKYITECMRRIGAAPENLSGILITHEHRDHICGAGVFSRKFNVPVYANEKTWAAIGDVLGPIAEENKRYITPEMVFGDLKVQSFSIPHDAADPVGYSFISPHHKFTVATDLGYVTEELEKHLAGSDALIIEANHDVSMLANGRYPYHLKKRIMGEKGHLSNDACGDLCVRLAKSGTSAIWLGHLSNENNKPQVAYETVQDILKKSGLTVGGGIALNVLPRYWIETGESNAGRNFMCR